MNPLAQISEDRRNWDARDYQVRKAMEDMMRQRALMYPDQQLPGAQGQQGQYTMTPGLWEYILRLQGRR